MITSTKMPQKTVQQLDAYIKATAVVYDHSIANLISGKTKVKQRRKQAFLTVLHYRKTSSDDCCAKRRPSQRWVPGQLKCKHNSRSHVGKQKLQIFVRTPLLHSPKTLCFQFDPGTSISTVKEWIQKKVGVDARYQRLYIRRNFQLCDLLTLEDNGIEKDENISLRLSFDGLLGGGPNEMPNFEKLLLDIAPKIRSTWKKLAKNLGFEEADIEILAVNENDSSEQSLAMLLSWWSKQKKSSEASQSLREALKASGLADLALEVPDSIDIEQQHDQEEQGMTKMMPPSLQENKDVSKLTSQQEGDVRNPKQVKKTSLDRTIQQETDKSDKSQLETYQVEEFIDLSSLHKSVASVEQLVHREKQIHDQYRPITEMREVTESQVLTSAEHETVGQEAFVAQPEAQVTGATARESLFDPHKAEAHDRSAQQDMVTFVGQQSGEQSHSSALVPWRQPDTSPALPIPQSYRLMIQPGQVNIKVDGSNNPTFLGPVVGPTINIVKNIFPGIDPGKLEGKMQRKRQKGPKQQRTGKPELSESFIQRLSRKISDDWEKLAFILGFSKEKVEAFRAKLKYNRVRQCRAMLGAWLRGQNTDEEARHILSNGLTETGWKDLARTVLEQPLVDVITTVTKKKEMDPVLTKILEDMVLNLSQNYGVQIVEERISKILKKCRANLQDVQCGSVTFVFRIESRQGVDELWRIYTSGELAYKLTEILITDELTTGDKSNLAIQATIVDSDYKQACKFFDELEKDQQKDKEDSSGTAEVQHTQLGESSTSTTASGSDPAELTANRCQDGLKKIDISTGSFQNLPECTCANCNISKYRYYYSKGQLLGVCCTKCRQEWLQERFLFHPDKVDSRPSVIVNNVVLKKQLKIEVESDPAFQVRGRRTMSKNFKFEGDSLKVGDHIAWHRPEGYWHHAIVSEVGDEAGNVQVIQWAWGKTARKMERKDGKINLNTQKGGLYRIDYSDEVTKINPSELVIARGRSMLDDPGEYSVFGDKCEAFASYCKTGFAQSCQLDWLDRMLKMCSSDVMAIIGRCFGDAAVVLVKECPKPLANLLFSEGMANVSIEARQITFDGIVGVGAGFVLLIEGIWCVYDMSKIYDKRVDGKISRVDFVQSSIRRVVNALVSTGFRKGGSKVGVETAICPGPGTAAGFLIGSTVGGVQGGDFARFVVPPVVGPLVARKCASIIGRDDRPVGIGDLQPGDHVVFYGFWLHPRHHAIVVDCDPVKGKVRVVHNTYKKGVVEEVLDFKPPVYRLLYDNACAAPDEVIERARSKIGDETYKYSHAFDNCKTFARWCKEGQPVLWSRLNINIRPCCDVHSYSQRGSFINDTFWSDVFGLSSFDDSRD